MRPEASFNLGNCVESSLCDDAGKASAVRGEVKIRKVGVGVEGYLSGPLFYPHPIPLFTSYFNLSGSILGLAST